MPADPMTDTELAALEEAERAMTPAPWRFSCRYQDAGTPNDIFAAHGPFIADFSRGGDAAGIAAARNALPRLLAEVRRLRAALGEACDEMERPNRDDQEDGMVERLRALAGATSTAKAIDRLRF